MNSTREESLFAAALAKSPSDGPSLLEGACDGDDALHRRPEDFLAAHELPDTMLEPRFQRPNWAIKCRPKKQA